jgi:hypothetical protein
VWSHGGPAAAVREMLEGLREYWIPPSALSVPLVSGLARSGFRKAIREHRWAMSGTLLGFLNCAGMVAGASRVLLESPWR